MRTGSESGAQSRWIRRRLQRQAVEQAFVAEFFGSAERYRAFVAGWAERKQMPEGLAEYVAALEQGE
jgi:hypothetical protein